MKRLLMAAAAMSLLTAQVTAPAFAGDDAKPKTEFGNPDIEKPAEFVTEKTGTFNGKKVSYRTVAGDTFIKAADGTPEATFFTYAYIKEGVKDPSTRPVTFIYNGGPGSASMWLHMGAFGPKRVIIPDNPADDGAPPYKVVDNHDTILDVSDLVFIDPVGTGYSRALGKEDPKKHWGVLEDGKSVARFIHQWIDNNNRWNSPKFLAGESYGTLRSAVVADQLTNRHNIGLNGIVLISTVLDYHMSRFQAGSVMSYVSFLPSYAATAWYHDMLPNKPKALEPFLQEVRDFARTDYAEALIAGARLSDAKQAEIIDKLHAYTGLKKSYLKATNMRINVFRFFKELMRDQGKVVGRLDSRYLGEEPDSAGEYPEADPFSYASGNAYTVAINDHLKNFLGVKLDKRAYKNSAYSDKNFTWNWNIWGKSLPNGGRMVNVVPMLGKAMRRNSDMHVLVAQGYYDFATPFFGAENAMAEPPIVQDRVEYKYYQSGHMMYVHQQSRLKLMHDVRAFIEAYDHEKDGK
ncbi:S10 family peptidase [Kordiimonas marina]|uniref:S10 family peptidase n=1 Tax=Kordiimonas marina TaxID=2872312 RepID=UPI001FF599A8|nr:peptidase S10 [Kordiimonas marina]MCJ9429739.1 peptidase S10 [Kordiimonas marina]